MEKPPARQSDNAFNYPYVSFTAGILGFLFLVCVILFPPLGKPIAYSGLVMMIIGAISGIIGYFKNNEPKAKGLCLLCVSFSFLPFLAYFFFMIVVLPSLLRGFSF
jgi:hypothetical protein